MGRGKGVVALPAIPTRSRCGARLGRLETQLALDALPRRSPALALTGEPAWRDTVAIRGLETLPVRLRA
ncbi:hypothetical protein [Pseudofrankia sp. DC12]|uniref:hypothetical protein n=1 Tax=Pseudofrankia sp. DC12 TaxID=683315 RepID=UPI0005F7F4D3|nr:hypothetical protein [Pseudofrankia sp. DC12]